MNRLGKKCFVFSASLHALLVLVLLFGAALMPRADEQSAFKPIHIYSADQVSELLDSQGGSPDVKAAPAPPAPEVKKPAETAPAPPAPKPEPPAPNPEPPAPKPASRRVEIPKPAPEPRHVEARTTVPDLPKPKIGEEAPVHWYNTLPWNKPKTKAKEKVTKEEADETPKTGHKVVLDKNELKATARGANQTTKATSDNKTTGEDATARAERRRAEKRLQMALRNLSTDLSKSTVTDETPGVGGGGQSWANYRDIIASKYYNAWVVPPDLDESTPTVAVTVTISRSGEIISARIVKSSGIRALDRSIQSAIDNVTFIEPFPPSSKEKEKTITINFNPQVKRQIG